MNIHDIHVYTRSLGLMYWPIFDLHCMYWRHDPHAMYSPCSLIVCVDPCVLHVLHTESLQQPLRCSIRVLAPGMGGQGFRHGPKVRLRRILDAFGKTKMNIMNLIGTYWNLNKFKFTQFLVRSNFLQNHRCEHFGHLWTSCAGYLELNNSSQQPFCFSLYPIVLVMSTLQTVFINYKYDYNGPLWRIALSVPPAPLLDKLKARFLW